MRLNDKPDAKHQSQKTLSNIKESKNLSKKKIQFNDDK